MIDDPEEEAWKEMEKEMGERVRKELEERRKVKSVEDAFADWEHSHRPEQYFVEMRAFKAGWVAAIRNEWAKERND
jgi:hypothetical protein